MAQPLIPTPPADTAYRRWGKRFLDLGLWIMLLPVWLPLFCLTALAVGLSLGWPILFWQQRPGRAGQLFWVCKFRSMRHALGPDGRPLPDAQRLTRFGRWLRASVLDELPQLWNILRGEMSFVGPRPLLVHYTSHFTPRQAQRLWVKPGLTGLAQVAGRNAVKWPARLELDAQYAERISLGLDLWIIWRTPAVLLRGQGVHAEGHATMPQFVTETDNRD
jgi:lipopolysaccharide/colanic/teichoic acid biosynthesis glycosyltransferase